MHPRDEEKRRWILFHEEMDDKLRRKEEIQDRLAQQKEDRLESFRNKMEEKEDSLYRPLRPLNKNFDKNYDEDY